MAQSITRERLLKELEKLTYAARMRRMVEVGRTARSDRTTTSTIAALEQGDTYERSLALQSCYGSGDGKHVLRALTDPSRQVRGLALSMVQHVCDGDETLAALHTIRLDMKQNLLKRLYRRRQAPVDQYLRVLEQQDDPDFSILLPYGSPALVAPHLDRLLPEAGQAELRRYARLHPVLMSEWLRGQVLSVRGVDVRLAWQVRTVLSTLSKRAPDAALELVRDFARSASIAELELANLLSHRPEELVEVILAANIQVHIRFDHIANRIATDRLMQLVRQQSQAFAWPQQWFPRLSPDKRLAVYQALRHAWYTESTPEGTLYSWLVGLLPREQREWEARRHLQLTSLETKPDLRLGYAAYLPWDEARATLEPFLRSPDADTRAVALKALTTATRYHRDRVGEVLQVMLARRNEQDPVRSVVLGEFSELPPSIWREEHLEDLGQVIRHALDARDLSDNTVMTLQHLLVKMIPFHPSWSGTWLATVMRERSSANTGFVGWYSYGLPGFGTSKPGIYNLGEHLSDSQVHQVAPLLLPTLQIWERQELESQLLAFARGLGERLSAFDGLLDIVERIIRGTRESNIAEGLVSLLVEHARPRADSLIRELLRKDGSWATLPTVYDYLHDYRQDLLTPYLGQRTYRGRFNTGKTRFVMPLKTGFHRWTTTQQHTFANSLGDVIDNPDNDASEALNAIDSLSGLTTVPPARLVALAGTNNENLVTQGAALTALGRLDNGAEAVPVLLEAVGDSRAHWAIYSLRKLLLEMLPEQAFALLRGIPIEHGPVTLAKEVVRLLGDVRAEGAFTELLSLNRLELHRDVRLALLRALWNYLDREETWEILEQAATSEDAALAIMAGRTSADRLSREAQSRLVSLIALVLQHRDVQVRLQALDRCERLPITDTEGVLLVRLVEALKSPLPDEVRAAASALFAIVTPRDSEAVRRVVEGLLPNRRSLQTTVQALDQRLHWDRELVPVARQVLTVLSTDTITSTLQVELAVETLEPEELITFLVELAEKGGLHADALHVALQQLKQSVQYSDPADLPILEARLMKSEHEQVRRLGVAVLVAAAEEQGWTEDNMERLRAYQADSSILVAAAAQFTFPVAEAE